ncbi:hypothetical protein [Aquicella lusitana]|uniref:Uncharacterized protein n=1 Tax=Aquicella lusitana TaxID=254246 RepID=A0A370H186_9COXI|nr:hypothetical protein [Aquicella lusitana]RDI48755.1 hypothetical protein C8D86_10134 [Aquicella lusitana]VVC73183.1 hypothetical protein AQULUS_09150 [Aquicella lusitana]
MLERSEGSLESLFENDEVYNTFLLLGEDREAALNYLYDLYNIKSKEKPLSIKDQLKELAQLSDPLLLYLVVEIQLVRKENGCFKFEKREPGCIEAEFQAFAEAFKMILEASSNQLKELDEEDAFLPASHSLFQMLHKIVTDTKKVKMETVKAETSGKYRSNNEECLVLPTNEVSDGGVAHLVELIQNKKIQTIMLCGNKDYKNYQNFINKSRILKELADIFQAIQKIEGADENTILGSINALHHKAYTKEQLNQYFKYFLIVVMIKNQLRSKLDQSVELKDRAIIETALKELALGDDFHTVIALIRKNAENSVFQSVIHSFTSELLMKAEEMTSDAAE